MSDDPKTLVAEFRSVVEKYNAMLIELADSGIHVEVVVTEHQRVQDRFRMPMLHVGPAYKVL